MNLTNRLFENEFSAKISTEHLSTLDGDKRVNRQLNAQSLYLWIWQWDVILDLCTLSAITGSRLCLFKAMKSANVLTNRFRDCLYWLNLPLSKSQFTFFQYDTYLWWITKNAILNSELKFRWTKWISFWFIAKWHTHWQLYLFERLIPCFTWIYHQLDKRGRLQKRNYEQKEFEFISEASLNISADIRPLPCRSTHANTNTIPSMPIHAPWNSCACVPWLSLCYFSCGWQCPIVCLFVYLFRGLRIAR